MQTVLCYYCQSNENTLYDSENGFNLVKCNECGLLFVNPRPDDKDIEEATKTGEHYGTNKLSVTNSFRKGKIKKYISILQDFYNDDFLNGIKWLDIGCGHGEFIAALKKYSKEQVFAIGLEPNIHKQKSAKAKGLNVNYFDLDKHTDKYDVISFLNVYSHLPDPPVTINYWKRMLKPGGEIFMETGDISLYEKTGLSKPYGLPDHLSFVSERIVVDILRNCGFEIINVIKYPSKRFNCATLSKEIVKGFLPYKNSSIKKLFNIKNSDMYIRAKLKIE